MKKAGKISYKEKEYNNKKQGATKLIFNIKSDDINEAFINCLRRSVTEVPIYNFHIFNFETNTSVFHNSYMELRLKNMPVWGINNTLVFMKTSENEINQEQSDEETEFDFDTNKNIDTSTLNQLTMYINYKNNSNNIVTVTTEHAQFYFAQEKIKNPYYVNIPIIKLQAGQEISFSTITNINIEKNDPLYSPCSVCFFKQNSENDYDFIIESRGQITEKRILYVAIQNIIKNIDNILKQIEKNTYEDEGTIIINNENHTIGNLITRGLQQHSNIEFAGYKMPHPLSNIIHIHYKTNKINIVKAIEDVIDYYTNLFNQCAIFFK
jgi:DNA-directed RNA polymerase subunit L